MTCGPRRSVKRVIELNVDVSDLITIDHYPQYAFVWLCHTESDPNLFDIYRRYTIFISALLQGMSKIVLFDKWETIRW